MVAPGDNIFGDKGPDHQAIVDDGASRIDGVEGHSPVMRLGTNHYWHRAPSRSA